MADENRAAAYTLALAREPYKFDFYQAIRRLECLYRDKPRVGESVRAVDDLVRLAQKPSMRFAPSTLASFELGKNGRPPRLAVYFLGLFGPNGPLPLHLTEYARDRLRNAADPTFSQFLDLFHHRMLSLFYRVWASAQPVVGMDRPDTDRFSARVGSLFGIGMKSLLKRDAIPDLAKLHYAGILACGTRHPEGLCAILQGFFKLPVALQQFVGRWMRLPEEYRWKLGDSPETGGLGTTAIVGSRVWECQQKFRVVFGPLSFADYRRLLPGGESLPRLVSVLLNYVGHELDWDLHLILKKEDVPRMQLGVMGQLGWTTWLRGEEVEEDADDLCLEPSHYVVPPVRPREELKPVGV